MITGRKRSLVRFGVSLLLAPLAALCAADTPDFGLMLNSDGDLSFTEPEPAAAERALRQRVRALRDTPIKTLMYSVGAGSDVLYYPTKVASVWGWRATKYDEKKEWRQRIASIKAGMRAGVDPIRVAGEEAQRLGLFFVPSYRMNDSHFMTDPQEYPLTGEFWIKHGQRLRIGDSPIASRAEYGNLLDFSHAEVRHYRLGVVWEIIERYADLMDGVELDFNRVQVLFPRGKAQERAGLITDMLAAVRQRLDERGKAVGRRFSLFVRVPPALKNCRWAGLDVETWMRKRLVDVLIPAQLMTLAHDMPIDEFAALANPGGCKIVAALYPRTSWMWPPGSNYAAPATRTATVELLRGAAINARRMGASGIQLYNFAIPPFMASLPALADMASPAIPAKPRSYAITPAYYLDHEDSYEYRKQIPLRLADGKPSTMRLFVGEDLSAQDNAKLNCVLRLGLAGAEPKSHIAITINGQGFHSGPLGKLLVPTTGRLPRKQPAPTAYVQWNVEQLSAFRQGWNDISVTVNGGAKAAVQVMEVQFCVSPTG
jgi:hypothetical protein